MTQIERHKMLDGMRTVRLAMRTEPSSWVL
nr:MAG TPA: hypothetical protein [Caudoviricetes sp.]